MHRNATEPRGTGFSLNIVFFPLNVVIFLNSASSAAVLVFYLPFCGPCMKSDTEEKPREARVRNYFRKKTIFKENPVSTPL